MSLFTWFPVSGLLLPGSPSAIVWTIVLIAVYSIKSVFGGRLQSHVRQEIFKGFSPSFTNFNPPGAVSLVGNTSGQVTPKKHTFVGVIFRTRSFSRVVTVFKLCFSSSFFLQTATRLSQAFSETPRCNNFRVTTLTKTCPLSSSFRVSWGRFNNFQSSECLSY